MFYLIHGLVASSEITLPLVELTKPSSIDITIKLNQIDSNFLATEDELNAGVGSIRLGAQDILVNIANIAKFRIQNGNEIHIDASHKENPDWEAIKLYLFGSIMGILLFQKGLLVLHSNAVLINNQAVLIAGKSGVGKSTLATIFQQQGYPVLSDDVVAINQNMRIQGGFPQVKLWEDTLKELNIPSHDLQAVATQPGKFHYKLANHLGEPIDIKVKAVYVLSVVNHKQSPMLKPIKGLERFNQLITHTYRNELIGSTEIQVPHLDLCAKLSENIHIANITRSDQYFSGFEIVDLIIDDIRQLI